MATQLQQYYPNVYFGSVTDAQAKKTLRTKFMAVALKEITTKQMHVAQAIDLKTIQTGTMILYRLLNVSYGSHLSPVGKNSSTGKVRH